MRQNDFGMRYYPPSKESYMSDFVESKIAWFMNPDREYGYRRSALREEIRRQKGVIGSYAGIVKPNPHDQQQAEAYLTSLEQALNELEKEAAQNGVVGLSEDEEIYWDMYRAIMEERNGKTPEPIDLRFIYLEFKTKYFGDSVPELSEDFIVKFIKLPFDIAGASYLPEDAVKLGVKRGIRINEKLREFPAEVKVALLHEMIHAAGVRKHGDEFKKALIALFSKDAYIEPLIL
jgi:hypothetical protein